MSARQTSGPNHFASEAPVDNFLSGTFSFSWPGTTSNHYESLSAHPGQAPVFPLSWQDNVGLTHRAIVSSCATEATKHGFQDCVAVKEVRFGALDERKAAKQEVDNLRDLSHGHVVRFLESFERGLKFGIVMYPVAQYHLGKYMRMVSETMNDQWSGTIQSRRPISPRASRFSEQFEQSASGGHQSADSEYTHAFARPANLDIPGSPLEASQPLHFVETTSQVQQQSLTSFEAQSPLERTMQQIQQMAQQMSTLQQQRTHTMMQPAMPHNYRPTALVEGPVEEDQASSNAQASTHLDSIKEGMYSGSHQGTTASSLAPTTNRSPQPIHPPYSTTAGQSQPEGFSHRARCTSSAHLTTLDPASARWPFLEDVGTPTHVLNAASAPYGGMQGFGTYEPSFQNTGSTIGAQRELGDSSRCDAAHPLQSLHPGLDPDFDFFNDDFGEESTMAQQKFERGDVVDDDSPLQSPTMSSEQQWRM